MINVTGCRNRAARLTTKTPLAGKYLFLQLQGPNSRREYFTFIIWYF